MTDNLVAHTTIAMLFEKLKPRESLGFLSWKVSRLMTNDLASLFASADIDVTVEQWRALIPLYKLDGLSQGELCELLSQEKTGVSRLVAALEKRGYVRREACESDRRIKYLYITDKGRDLLEATVDIAVNNRDRLTQHVDPEELAICKRVLWQIIEPTLDCSCESHNE